MADYLSRLDFVILDELGYLPFAQAGGDAQREACEAYIKSQAHEGWRLINGRYDDGAFSGASLDRPALQELLAEVRAGNVDVIVVYKVDRLTRSRAAA